LDRATGMLHSTGVIKLLMNGWGDGAESRVGSSDARLLCPAG
jgi:hypothetical protein